MLINADYYNITDIALNSKKIVLRNNVYYVDPVSLIINADWVEWPSWSRGKNTRRETGVTNVVDRAVNL